MYGTVKSYFVFIVIALVNVEIGNVRYVQYMAPLSSPTFPNFSLSNMTGQSEYASVRVQTMHINKHA